MMIPSEEWLFLSGTARELAVEAAANQLSSVYRHQWPQTVPTDLRRLAETLNVQIRFVNDLESTAQIIPSNAGFTIFIQKDASWERRRTAVAHELAHTLFYQRERGRLRRMIPAGDQKMRQREEAFCFAVGRRLLVPKWHLATTGIESLNDAEAILYSLIQTYKVTRDVAARVMLQDYRLVHGIAGEWSKQDAKWLPIAGKHYPSKSLNAPFKNLLKAFVCTHLDAPEKIATWDGDISWKTAAADPDLASAYLSCIPDIGPHVARDVVTQIGVLLPRLSSETAHWLLQVPGIGAKRQEKIKMAFDALLPVRLCRSDSSDKISTFVVVQAQSTVFRYHQ